MSEAVTPESSTPCPVCDTAMEPYDKAVVMHKYDAVYHRCPGCGLVAIRDTPWLEEAYTSAIHDADQGLLRRARRYSLVASTVIRSEKLADGRFLDWAGGYGVFCQVMRDRGLDFWQHDDYATPVFARDYQHAGDDPFTMATAFEVMEHLYDPRAELAGLAARTDYLLFSTELLPEPPPRVGDWWYYMPEVGQHITFHTPTSLRLLAESLGYELTTNERNWHLFHRKPVHARTKLALSAGLNRRARQVRDGARSALGRLR